MKIGNASIDAARTPGVQGSTSSSAAQSMATDAATLTWFNHRIDQVRRCARVSLTDSTTGAHYALDERASMLFVVKKNDEWLFEYFGNHLARTLGVNIPDFAILDQREPRYSHLASKLHGECAYPLIVSAARKATNIKEIADGQGHISDPVACFEELGRVFVLDYVMGNWDRFPVFPADDVGNFGNIIYEADKARFCFIDNVALKHADERFVPRYVDTQRRIDDIFKSIQRWLEPKFPRLLYSVANLEAFKAGVHEGKRLMVDNREEIDAVFERAQDFIRAHTTEVAAAAVDAVSAWSAPIPPAPNADDETALNKTAGALIDHIQQGVTDEALAAKLVNAVVEKKALNAITLGKARAALLENKVFAEHRTRWVGLLDARSRHDAQSSVASARKQPGFFSNLKQPVELEKFLDLLKQAGLPDENSRLLVQSLQSLSDQKERTDHDGTQLDKLIGHYRHFISS